MADYLLARTKGGPGDRALLALFEKHPQIAEHYEDCVPALNGEDDWGWKPSICPLAEAHGPMFHKGFRQYDVTPNPRDDMAVWSLLSGFYERGSETFWDAHAHSMETL